MLLLSLKLLLGSLFFLLLFLRPTFAQETFFFNEEFNVNRTPNELDPNKWVVYPNKRTTPDPVGCMFDTIREMNGLVLLHQCNTTPQFPYVISKTNPVPNANFNATIRFQFSGSKSLPSGISFVDKAPDNGAGQTALFSVGFEESGQTGQDFRIEYKDTVVFSKDDDSNFYIFGLQKEGKIYKVFLNNQLIFTSPPTEEKIGALYLGSPSILTPSFGWSDLRIDYIRVVQTGPSEETTPQPFLDLPWDYKSSGKNFNQIAFDPNSWFDHKYPLQNFNCCIQSIIDYKGELKDKSYKSHSGYDYGVNHEVIKNTPVLAAAAGKATFVPESKSGGAGNMIKIDHGNGYQTWYEHLEEIVPGNELVVSEEGKEVSVSKGQKLGRVGLTGQTTGYHIHLSVFKDINNNGNFSDDYPFGLTDPLGWEGNYTDPWEEYTQGDKHGAKSYKLFTGLTPPATQQIPPSGGSITKNEVSINIPNNASSESLLYKIDFGPFEKASETIKSITPSLFLNATNNLGNLITNFNNPLTFVYNYSKVDLSNTNEDSLSFYYFNEQTNLWEQIPSTLDKINKTISTQTSHFSQFAVMGELLDSISPKTSAEISGTTGINNWYSSKVTVSLVSEDNPRGKGVDYIVYSMNGENWNEYQNPLEFNSEGEYKVWFLAHDKVGNEESPKTIEFKIDKTPPIINITSPQVNAVYTLNQNISSNYFCEDNDSGIQSCQGDVENNQNINTKNAGLLVFKVEAIDNSGNKTIKEVPYKIQYQPSGLCNGESGHSILQPINPDGSSIFKQGSTVPAKFRVCDVNGNPISDPSLVKSFNLVKTVSGTNTTSVNESVVSTIPDPNFRYDSLKKQWVFNMNTKSLSSSKTYFYKILLNDLSEILFSFGLK